MISVYVTLIINHRKSLTDVPSDLRPKVIEQLLAKGYDTEGNKIDVDS